MLSLREFETVLEHERRRTDRTGLGFSVAILNTAKVRCDPASIETLVSTIRRRVRSTDQVGWFDSESVGVLLVDTPPEGARHFLHDLMGALPEHLPCLEPSSVIVYPTELMPQSAHESDATSNSPGRAGFTAPESAGSTSFPNPAEIRCSLDTTPSFPLESRLARGIPFWKRGLDVLIALPLLVLLLPLFLFIAAWIKIVSPGPILFHQHRIGFLGRSFKIWKFRTMQAGSDQTRHSDYVRELVREEPHP